MRARDKSYTLPATEGETTGRVYRIHRPWNCKQGNQDRSLDLWSQQPIWSAPDQPKALSDCRQFTGSPSSSVHDNLPPDELRQRPPPPRI